MVIRRAQLQKRDHIVCPLQRPTLGDQKALQELFGRRLAKEGKGRRGDKNITERLSIDTGAQQERPTFLHILCYFQLRYGVIVRLTYPSNPDLERT